MLADNLSKLYMTGQRNERVPDKSCVDCYATRSRALGRSNMHCSQEPPPTSSLPCPPLGTATTPGNDTGIPRYLISNKKHNFFHCNLCNEQLLYPLPTPPTHPSTPPYPTPLPTPPRPPPLPNLLPHPLPSHIPTPPPSPRPLPTPPPGPPPKITKRQPCLTWQICGSGTRLPRLHSQRPPFQGRSSPASTAFAAGLGWHMWECHSQHCRSTSRSARGPLSHRLQTLAGRCPLHP